MKSFLSYAQKFTEKAEANGYSLDNINKCLQYARPLIENELPVIFNLSHFSALVKQKK